jgi:hypothetical protein
MDVEELIQNFNDGFFDTEIKPYFNTLINFFKFIKKYNLLEELDLREIPPDDFSNELFDYLVENGIMDNLDYNSVPEEFQNNYLLHGLEYNYENTVKYITSNLLTDVEIRPDGFYLYLGNDRDELASFFCGSSRRDSSPENVAKLIFSDEGLGHDWYFDNDTKPSDVIDDLDEKNTIHLKDAIFKEIGNVELSLEDYSSDFFESLSEEQSDSYLDYFGSYTTLMKQLIYDQDYDCINFNTPDYPDWSTTQKYINEMFYDYI